MADSVRLHAPAPGAANRQLHVQAPQYWDDEESLPTIPIPIVTLEPEPLAAWSRAIARAEDVWIPGFELVIPSQAAVEQGQNGYTLYEESVSVALSAAERVQRFRAHASEPARRLAGLLAMLPVTLQIIRLVQQAMLPDPRQVHVAEVFLSGLLKVISPHSKTLDPDDVQYDFVDGVRENLLNFVSPDDSDRVLTEITTFITSKFAHPLDFAALLANPLSKEGIVIDQENRPFALMGAKVLRRFGGEYRDLADWLEEQVGEASLEEQPTGSATSVGIGLPYKVDGEEQVRGEGVDASKQGVVGDRAAHDSVEAGAQEIIDSGGVVEVIKLILKYLVPRYELEHLQNFDGPGEFLAEISSDFIAELRHLRLLGFIERVPGHGFRSLEAAKTQNRRVNVKDHFFITEDGRAYLKQLG